MTAEIPLGPGAEFDVIRALLERWGDHASGIGDDAAVLRLARGDALVTSVDSSVEGRHFKREWLSPREIGYRAVAAALSDLAAMAARPIGVLIAFALPDAWRGELGAIADGIGDAVSAAQTVIRGGSISAAGEAVDHDDRSRRGLRAARTNGCPCGRSRVRHRPPGRAACGDRAARPRRRGGSVPRSIRAPVPRLIEAQWLADHGATAAIDISDGLVADARHLAAASRASITIDAARVPCVSGVDVETALESGEEYELVVTSAQPIDTAAFASRFALPLTEIGTVGEGTTGFVTVHGGQSARVANMQGHDHLSR